MGQYNLNRIFNPRQIAVVGASEKPGSIGNAIMVNLINGEYSGRLLPVNPKYEKMHGLSAYKSLAKIKEDIDLAVIATPMRAVPDVVAECVDKKIAGSIVISAGGKEIGPTGKRIEEKIIERAYRGGLRIA